MSEKEAKTVEVVENKPKEAKKAPKKAAPKKKRSRSGAKKPVAAKKPEIFSDSIGALFPDLAKKIQKSRDERIKKQIRDAQSDPKVLEANKKFASKK
jgi:hypothetical protein